MSTSRQLLLFRSSKHAAISRAAASIILAIGLLTGNVNRASAEATPAETATANEPSAPSQQPLSDLHGQFDWLRTLFAGPTQLSPQELYEQVGRSVVTIKVRDENFQDIASGSGFFINEAVFTDRSDASELEKVWANSDSESEVPSRHCYVLTNYHVIRPAVFACIVLSNGDKLAASQVVAEDEKLDLALLMVSVPTSLSAHGIPLAASDPPVMTTVYAIGSPRGFSGTASEGRVSAYREILGGNNWLQTTAPVSPGSSGGPLLLADGSLVGVTTLVHPEGQNLNFAIPVSVIHSFLSTAPFQARDIAVGASIPWHEMQAFADMNEAVKAKQSNASILELLLVGVKYEADRKAVAILSDAWRELDKPPADDEDALAHYQKVIASAQGGETSLPDQFKYLMHYVVGKASLCAAMQAEPDAKDGTRTEESCIRYRTNGYSTDAYYHLVKAIELKPDFPAAYEQLYQHHRLSGKWADALLMSDPLVKRMPRCAEALAMRAECYRVLGQADSARQDLEAATVLSPANRELNYQFAEVLTGFGEYDDAIESYQRALACEASPSILLPKPPDLRDKLHYRLGVAYRKAGNVEKALHEFATAKALGWSADDCDRQIAECQQHRVLPVARLYPLPSTLQGNQATVYVTKSGRKYHRDGCEYLAQSKIPLSLADAERMYEPCSHCHPPVPRPSGPDGVNVAISQRAAPHD